MARFIGAQRIALRAGAWLAIVGLSACGGGGSSDSTPAASATTASSAQYAQRCSAINPYAPTASRTGTLTTEKQWLRAYFDEAYLWYDEVPTVNAYAAAYTGSDAYLALDNYFQALKTPALTASGNLKDKFSFTYPTAQWNALIESGVTGGYGAEFVFGSYVIDALHAHRDIRIAYIEPGTEAAAKGLLRGDTLVTVDGVSADDSTVAGIDALNAAIFPTDVGVAHSFVFARSGSSNVSVTMTSANITKTPVLTRSVLTGADGKKIGYMLFNDHLATAEAQLIEAVGYFKAQGIADLVLDIRYNGGGYLYIASELAYMIAGATRTQNAVFEQLSFNAKRSADTNDAASKTPFYSTGSSGAALPSLNLARVYVLAQASTCSASESVINSLRGVDVDVRLIGGTTCGKPYGFTAKDNCGISYFPIEFKGTNAKGFGDYPDGFVPGASGSTGVPGCVVADDLATALGDPTETMLATALGYRSTGACAPMAGMARPQSVGRGATAQATLMMRGPARENRILVPR